MPAKPETEMIKTSLAFTEGDLEQLERLGASKEAPTEVFCFDVSATKAQPRGRGCRAAVPDPPRVLHELGRRLSCSSPGAL